MPAMSSRGAWRRLTLLALVVSYAMAVAFWILWRIAIEEHRPHEWQAEWATGLAALSSAGVFVRSRWIRRRDQREVDKARSSS